MVDESKQGAQVPSADDGGQVKDSPPSQTKDDAGKAGEMATVRKLIEDFERRQSNLLSNIATSASVPSDCEPASRLTPHRRPNIRRRQGGQGRFTDRRRAAVGAYWWD